jgi:hypothetical protein
VRYKMCRSKLMPLLYNAPAFEQAPQQQRIDSVPQITIRTTFSGREEAISEYICDWPDCPAVAVHVVAFVRELRLRSVMCAEHAARLAERDNGDGHQ